MDYSPEITSSSMNQDLESTGFTFWISRIWLDILPALSLASTGKKRAGNPARKSGQKTMTFNKIINLFLGVGAG